MYQTWLSKSDLKLLRSEGFIHVTGIELRTWEESEPIYFQKNCWGKYFQKWSSRDSGSIVLTVVVLWNGEVWLRYGGSNEIGSISKRFNLKKGAGRSETALALDDFFDGTCQDNEALMDILVRAADPYFSVYCEGECLSNDPNPQNHIRNGRKLRRMERFLRDIR